MYKYRGFGLYIIADIEFPELLPADFPVADITISSGKTPEKLEGLQVVHRAFSSITKDEFLLTVKNICTYYVSNGNKIIVEPVMGIDERSVRLFLLGTVMAAVLYQRGNIPLHASAIIKDEQLILFAGNSGAGKSTLLASLAARGHTIFTDDICVLQQRDMGITGTASYPMLKLWEDAITRLDDELFTKGFKIRPELPKYGQFFYDSFDLRSLPVAKIFILAPQNTADIKIVQLSGVPAFKRMEKQAYKYQLIANTQLRTVFFTLLSRLIAQTPVYEVIRPVRDTNVELLCNAIEPLL